MYDHNLHSFRIVIDCQHHVELAHSCALQRARARAGCSSPTGHKEQSNLFFQWPTDTRVNRGLGSCVCLFIVVLSTEHITTIRDQKTLETPEERSVFKTWHRHSGVTPATTLWLWWQLYDFKTRCQTQDFKTWCQINDLKSWCQDMSSWFKTWCHFHVAPHMTLAHDKHTADTTKTEKTFCQQSPQQHK